MFRAHTDLFSFVHFLSLTDTLFLFYLNKLYIYLYLIYIARLIYN